MRNFLISICRSGFTCALLVSTLAVVPLSQAEELLVYTAIEADALKEYKNTFNKVHPDIDILFVRDSTGIVTAKLLAEKDNPRSDVVWGLAATSLLVLANKGMLHPYAPKGVDKLDPRFVDAGNPPVWTGMDAWVACICYNTIEARKYNLPKPSSWKDLLNPGVQRTPDYASSCVFWDWFHRCI